MKLVICFLGIKQFECDNYFIHSLNHEMYLQRVQKYTLCQFDDKRCYGSNIKVNLGMKIIIVW